MELDRHLARSMLTLHPIESSRILESLDPAEAAEMLAGLEPERTAAVLRPMVRSTAARLAAALPPDRGGAVLAALPAEVTADLLRRMEAASRKTLLGALPPRVAESLRPMIQFAEGTAGVLMDPDIPAFPLDLTAGEALLRIKQNPDAVRGTLYVVDDDQVLAGFVPLAVLLASPAETTLRALSRPVDHAVKASTSFSTLLAHPGWEDMTRLPVVDDRGVFLGTLDSRRLRRLEAETRRDADSDETAIALGELFRAGLGGLLDSVLAPRGSSSPGGRS